MRAVAFLALICVVFAQDPSTETPPNPAPDAPPQQPQMDPMMGTNLAFMQAKQEEMFAKTYLDVMLKFSVSQYNTMAASMYMYVLHLEYSQDNSNFAFLERSSKTLNLEEDEDEDETLFNAEDDDEKDDDTNERQAKLQLLASYYLLSATRSQKYQIVFYAGELQNDFTLDRAMTLSASMAGGQLPPQLMQLLYLKNYSTLLKTMKLSQAFRMNAHFTTWLEDAMSVYGGVVADAENAELIADELTDDLIQDKMFAFMSYYQFAQLDLQTFYIDYYLELTFMQLSAPQAGAGVPQASFLEEEATAEPNQFAPLLYAQSPQLYMKIYKLYFTMFQYQAAQSGLMSVFAESMAQKMENDDDDDNDEKAAKIRSYSQTLFSGGFAGGLMRASQLQQLTAMFELYSLYAPFFQQGAQQQPGANAAH